MALGLSFIISHLSFSMMFTSCADDELKGYVPKSESIRIVQNDLVFKAQGSQGTVIVESEGAIEATVDAAWCSAAVSGKTVTVTVESNESFDGRTALLTLRSGSSSRQLPIQQQGLVLDLPLVENGHHSPIQGDVFTTTIHHDLQLTVSSAQTWIHPEVDGNELKVTVDSNIGGHIRRGTVVCSCGTYQDTLHIAQFDLQDDVVGSYYLMGYYGGNGGNPAATRFNIILRNDSLLMNWPRERYEKAFIHIPFDATTCTLFIPSGFKLYSEGSTTETGYFYDTDGKLAASTGAGAAARLVYSENSGYNSAQLVAHDWPGHTLSGFVIRSTSLVSATLIQLGSPVLMRVGPVDTVLAE